MFFFLGTLDLSMAGISIDVAPCVRLTNNEITLGSAVALKLLFGLPLLAGVLITAFDVLIVLALQGVRGLRRMP